jgi:hypothetical protein
MFGYQIQEGGYKFQPLLFSQRTKGIIDERFNHGGQIADYITDVLRDLLGYFNNPTGDQQA